MAYTTFYHHQIINHPDQLMQNVGFKKKLKNDRSILILRPGKDNGFIDLDRIKYDNATTEITTDEKII